MKELTWSCHTANLLDEVLNRNPGMGIMNQPIMIFRNMLLKVAERASKLNDATLNALMCRLTLYEIADPESKEYDPEMIKKIYKLAETDNSPCSRSVRIEHVNHGDVFGTGTWFTFYCGNCKRQVCGDAKNCKHCGAILQHNEK